MTEEKKRIEAELRAEISKCQSEVVFHKKNIEHYMDTVKAWTELVEKLEFRIETLQKLILTLND